jgi:RNA polymerase sigma-70 factor (ECF subfamily)
VDLLLRTALKARDGDRVALEGFLRLVQADVWRTCRYLVDLQSADDLSQEVLVRVVGSLHRLTPDHQVRGWVLGIARHVCLDEIRRRQRRRRVESAVIDLRPSASTEIDSDLAIRDLIERLHPERREAFVLTQVIGLSYEEAATLCDCPIGTIRSRVARARIDLRTMASGSVGKTFGTLPPPRATGSE